MFDLGQETVIQKWNPCQTFKSAVLGAFKCLPWNSFYIHVFWPKPNASLLFYQSWGVLTPLERSLNIIKCQKWGKAPYQNMSFRETLIITLLTDNILINLDELHLSLSIHWRPALTSNLSNFHINFTPEWGTTCADIQKYHKTERFFSFFSSEHRNFEDGLSMCIQKGLRNCIKLQRAAIEMQNCTTSTVHPPLIDNILINLDKPHLSYSVLL